MNPINFLRAHPPLGGAILSVVGAALGAYIHNPEMVAALVGVAAVFIGIHQVVTPVTSMVTNVTNAATAAATQTASSLSNATVGSVGVVTDEAKQIVNNTVDNIVGGLLGK